MSNRRKPSRAYRELYPPPFLRPEEFPIGSAQSRACARRLLMDNQKRIQVVFSCPDTTLQLKTSTCTRYTIPDGTLIEVLHLDGNADELSESELEQFILRFPISYHGERNT